MAKNSMVGKVALAMLSIDDHSVSQIRLSSSSGAPLLLLAKASEGKSVPKGEKALIVDFDKINKVFIVEPYQA